MGHGSNDADGDDVLNDDPLPGDNFTNILRAAFTYERVLRRFSVLTVWLCNFSSKVKFR